MVLVLVNIGFTQHGRLAVVLRQAVASASAIFQVEVKALLCILGYASGDQGYFIPLAGSAVWVSCAKGGG